MEKLIHTPEGKLKVDRSKEDSFFVVGTEFICTNPDYKVIYKQFGTITENDVKRSLRRQRERVGNTAQTYSITFPVYQTAVYAKDVELIED